MASAADTGGAPSSRRRLSRRPRPGVANDTPWPLRLGAGTLVAVLLPVMVYPLLWIVFGSLKTTSQLVENPFGPPTSPSFASIAKLWTDSGFTRFFANSMIIAAASVIGVLVMSSLAAFALERSNLRYTKWVAGLFVVGFFIPQEILLIPIFQIMDMIGIRNTLLAVIFVQWSWTPFAILLLRAYFRTIPTSILEAATIDGCSELQILRRIVLPLAKPALVTVGILYFMMSWNDFIWPLVLIQNTTGYTVQLGVFRFQGQFVIDYGSQLAGLVVAVLPPLLFYLIFQKSIKRGLIAGAVKN
jgi:ABC-type glycerol-3-phosphate transport system permease component